MKKPGMEEPVGEMEEGGGGFPRGGGPTSSDFATVTLPVVWPSDALTRSLTLVVDKRMECDENRLK